MNLVIVESPAKGKTIEKYLGKDYKVVASFGHVRDLPKRELGVDVEHNFQPKYIIPPRSKKTVSYLKKVVHDAHNIYLATDYDREGEAIAWHIVQACGLQTQNSPDAKNGQGSDRNLLIKNKTHQPINPSAHNIYRITFHEVTKPAVEDSIKHPREIDINLVDAQQARRILDRLVGYKLSPFLWKKIYSGLSAGRVQSVAVRLVVDREREIENFKPEEYWGIIAKLKSHPASQRVGVLAASAGENSKLKTQELEAVLVAKNNTKLDKLAVKSEKEAKAIINELQKAKYVVTDVSEKEERRWPYPPFTTSKLQQDAFYKFGFSSKKTMKLAQDLYEEGLITYMRTDSTNLSLLAINSTRKFIEEEFGKQYLPESALIYKTKIKNAQEAHEAIRPTNVQNQKSKIQNQNLGDDHLELYDLIWRRMVACQMTPLKLNTTQVDICAGNYTFRARGSAISFDGFSKIWPIKIEEKIIPPLGRNDILDLIELLRQQHFTEPPARYSEATLVRALEEKGIGRPSTYAPIISTILERGYVRLEKRLFFPQEIGYIVIDLLKKHFPDIVDIDFTVKLEDSLDKIAEGKEQWYRVLKDFYDPFEKNLANKYKEINKKDIMEEQETEELCPKCRKKMVMRMGRFGRFLACSGFPDCKYTAQIIIKTGLKCPDCKEGEIIERKTKKGKVFWGCSNYPKCKWASWTDPRK